MVGNGGSNVEEGRKKGLDSTVGALVWVQRRNGCWWPGQIMGLDELPEDGSGSSSPRSGTPIRLLGRDDSSVEWYDLETAKGVKAFRCGEYDTCIEKAKVSAPKFLKRSLKYPRREIAIFYALEIEKSSVLKNDSNHDRSPDNEAPVNCENGSASRSHANKGSECSSEETSSEETTSACEENSNSTQELSHSGISYETNGSTCLQGQQHKRKRRKTPNDSEDDGHEGFKRMKGLNDLGVGSERKIRVLALSNPGQSSSVSLHNTRAANCTAVGTLTNGGAVPTFKKKRSQVVHIHELLKRKNRRRPLTKVLENTTMVPVRIICDEFANPFERSDAISPFYDGKDGIKDTDLLNEHLPEVDSPDTLFDAPFIDEELPQSGISSVWQPSSPLKPRVSAFKGISSRNLTVQTSSLEHEAADEHGASKWQSKGKRKARFLCKNDEMNSQKKSDAYGMGLEAPVHFPPSSNGFMNGLTGLRKHISMSGSTERSFSYRQRRFFPSSWESPGGLSLFEVEVTVEATRPQTQHVPYISLMSKLSCKPITGHPVAVEALEDGFCDLQTSNYPASGSCELDDEDTEMDYVVEPKVRKPMHIKLRSHSSRRKRKGKSSKSKKRHGSSSKKTRRLSSLTSPLKLNLGKRKPMVQSSKGPTLACVPLKIVFSRIHEALNGSSRSAHRAVTLNGT
ncbi:uncharacterized protein At1g51745-like [Chenopodium quinoa]|uniref:PWWP domain-containing protein n=1 Tax=Chenopodium quinoa TaxID=63459 RepID=A0A803M2E7_CHEQI|nr:uncharacterized protein At1g51745-like [Chenopodium quinoa]XP_021729560.1 uncharacterized protein At1g51745-like [Chenopodium quinoa]